ncbi:hypothetical protein ACFOLA_10505 [Salinicoccus hispanicus]|uniref:Uncharacterized protein n=1 Tax=Salinicoccus hispanicus TaxID=157225 RepID=A0A6N8TYM0_9STAP|nr:hypothetical protein [Salinicoccus hispanicus]MXQ51098.1 hypothetical protein [Salinicoccus hispanicus]
MEKLFDRFIGDERKRKAAGDAALITLLLMWGYMIIRMLLVAMEIWETNMVQNDLYFVMLSIIIFNVIAFRNETDDLIYSPIARKELPYKKGRFSGRFGIYLMESIAGAIFITIVEMLVRSLIDRSFSFDFLMFISSIISFTIILIFVNIVSGEMRVRRFRKMEE